MGDGLFLDTGVKDWKTNPGGTLNHYHRLFAAKLGHHPSADFIAARSRPGCTIRVSPGLFARNSWVAKADHCIALTFGRGGLVADGGTAHTMASFLARKSGTSVHIDLNTYQAYSPARISRETKDRAPTQSGQAAARAA